MRQNGLLLEQINLVQRQVPIVLAGNLVVATALIFIMLPKVTGVHLALWSALICALILARVVFYMRVRQTGIEHTLPRRTAQFIFFSLCSGILWGTAGALFFTPSDPLAFATLLLLLAGLVAGSVASTSAYPTIFFVFSIPALVPVAALALTADEGGIQVIGIFVLVFLAVNLAYCLTIHRTVVETLRLRFENVELVDALSEQKRVAERANVAKSKFLAAASHDLRQPLHAQGLLLGALRAEVASQKGQELLTRILSAKSSLDQLFDGLLDISRLDAGVVQPKFEVFNVQGLLNAVKDEFDTQATQKGLILGVESEEVYVRNDKVLLGRILRNLVSNAIRYTESGVVSTRVRAENGRVIIDVADSGRGIPETEMRNIFSEYHQIANPERDRNKGLGLGLAIVDKLANLLEIEISVASKENSGSTFTLVMDQCEDALEADQHEIPRIDIAKSITLLAIDDSHDVLEGMEKLFEQWGYKSILASSAVEAIERLTIHDGPIDAVIADYRLRNNRTGVEAIDLVREEFNLDVPGIIITGDTAPDRMIEAEKSGYRLLHKPVSAAELRTAIHHELIGRS